MGTLETNLGDSSVQNDRMARLRDAGEAYREKLAKGEVERLDPMQKAKKNPTSLRAAINANCYDCNGKENWHVRTKFCIIDKCPFWNVRKGGKGVSIEQCRAENIS